MKFLYTKEKVKDLLNQLGSIGEKGDKGDKGDKGNDGDTIKDSNSGLPLKVWTGTQEEFDLVTVKDPETLYLIKGTEVSP